MKYYKSKGINHVVMNDNGEYYISMYRSRHPIFGSNNSIEGPFWHKLHKDSLNYILKWKLEEITEAEAFLEML